jgi:hypothetical protein
MGLNALGAVILVGSVTLGLLAENQMDSLTSLGLMILAGCCLFGASVARELEEARRVALFQLSEASRDGPHEYCPLPRKEATHPPQ